MKVIDLLSIVSDESTIEIFENNEPICLYDGKNSIPEELNGREVLSISSGRFKINVDI